MLSNICYTLQNPELLEEWKEGTGLTLYEGYGQTETVKYWNAIRKHNRTDKELIGLLLENICEICR